LSFQTSVVAMLIVETAAPPGVYRNSASRPRLPTRMTLFTLPIDVPSELRTENFELKTRKNEKKDDDAFYIVF
jgi:hypothetical protein